MSIGWIASAGPDALIKPYDNESKSAEVGLQNYFGGQTSWFVIHFSSTSQLTQITLDRSWNCALYINESLISSVLFIFNL
jgi:hypothetical protein